MANSHSGNVAEERCLEVEVQLHTRLHQNAVQSALRTISHHDAYIRCIDADTDKVHQIRMAYLPHLNEEYKQLLLRYMYLVCNRSKQPRAGVFRELGTLTFENECISAIETNEEL